MRVLVVDDSAFMRRAVSQMLMSEPDIHVVATARNGKEGVEMARLHQPDVITMDIEMPEMDGLTALRVIMREAPTAVLMLSSLTTEGSHASLTALRLGAADVLAKDMSQVSLSIGNIKEELIERVRAIASTNHRKRLAHPTATEPAHSLSQPPKFRPGQFDVVCIGSSTGGPPVLETIVSALPSAMSAPVVIAQHMPELFTKSMSERLAQMCQLKVVHGADGMMVEPYTVYIAPGGKNTHLVKAAGKQLMLRVNNEPVTAIYKPSVDALFESAAKATGARTLGIVLTGMGEDGVVGGRLLHEKGGTLLAQNQETCVVYGMPKAVTQACLIVASLNPQQIAQSLYSLNSSVGGAPPVNRAG